MRIIVARWDLEDVVATLKATPGPLVFDIESTGLSAYHNSKMFSIAIADLSGNSWYFNLKNYDNLEPDFVLTEDELKPIFEQERLWIAHNAKFDLRFMNKHGLMPKGRIADTKALARLYENHHHPWVKDGGYSLDACAKRWLDQNKDDRVKDWMDQNFAYTSPPSGKKNYHFDLVPFDIISEYAMIDAEVTAKLYVFLREHMYETDLWEVEIDLTSTLFSVEHLGLMVNREYCEEAAAHERTKLSLVEHRLTEMCGKPFVDSAKFLSPILKDRGFELPQTDKGNDQVTDEVLKQKPDDKFARAILSYRDANKRLNTYWQNYLILCDEDGIIHPSIDQSGTTTGRMSCYDPNLQNIPSEDQSTYPIRRAFVARPGFQFVSIDYKAVEFRLALIYANEQELMAKIREDHDPHQAAADLTGLTRKEAKVFNFATLYGAGKAKLAGMLGCTPAEAQSAKYEYFAGLPKLKQFINDASNRMKSRGFVKNMYGRKYILDDPNFAYKACNYIIQGSAADIMKKAMIECEKLLIWGLSRIVLTVHDEIIFEVHADCLSVIKALKTTMEQVYENENLPLECSVEIGPNLHDMEPYEI